ncbi:hypothetical protein BC332_28180 [Capsicum chinense]|nr:hypothetical protein BC332_28180 [Capsicum chinense]
MVRAGNILFLIGEMLFVGIFYCISGLHYAGKNKSVVLWSSHDQVSTLTTDQGDAKSLGSGTSNPKPSIEGPTVQATGIFQGHDDTVQDVQFCPPRKTDRSCRFGFVTLSTVEEAEKVIVLYNHYVSHICPSLRSPKRYLPTHLTILCSNSKIVSKFMIWLSLKSFKRSTRSIVSSSSSY